MAASACIQILHRLSKKKRLHLQSVNLRTKHQTFVNACEHTLSLCNFMHAFLHLHMQQFGSIFCCFILSNKIVGRLLLLQCDSNTQTTQNDMHFALLANELLVMGTICPICVIRIRYVYEYVLLNIRRGIAIMTSSGM